MIMQMQILSKPTTHTTEVNPNFQASSKTHMKGAEAFCKYLSALNSQGLHSRADTSRFHCRSHIVHHSDTGSLHMLHWCYIHS